MGRFGERLQDPRFQRDLFKRLNVLMLLMWRLGLGRALNIAPSVLGRMMVLVTTGRRSGQPRRVPVNFTRDERGLHLLAGFGEATHWYRNIQGDPQVEVWLPDGCWCGRAEPLAAEEHPEEVRDILLASGFASRAFEGIDPRTISLEELRTLAERFPLVRIHLTERVRRPAPGDLVWVWPLGALLACARRRDRRRR